MTVVTQLFESKAVPNRRRWFRFSMRNLLVFTTLLACLLGWVAKERSQSEFERQVGENLAAKHCRITYLGPCDSLDPLRRRLPSTLCWHIWPPALGSEGQIWGSPTAISIPCLRMIKSVIMRKEKADIGVGTL